MTQAEEIITVYRNRHMRAKTKIYNDMNQTYISRRALRTLMATGVKLRFIREIKTYEDVTEIFTAIISKGVWDIKGKPVAPLVKEPKYDGPPKKRDAYAG